MNDYQPSISVVMLTHNEEIHIERCIRSLKPIARKIFIVDSFSTDRTADIGRSLGAEVVQRKWKNYADQFQWGLDHCGANTDWVMRMDADEYLESELQDELMQRLPQVAPEIDGICLKRKHMFMGKWIRHGGRYPLILLRIWRVGKGRIERRWMDEHIILMRNAKTITMKYHLVDENLKGVTFFVDKHNFYATREAIDILNQKYAFFETDDSLKNASSSQPKQKRILKDKLYSRLPLGLRASLYFIYRFFFQLGFLDGTRGWMYHFFQGLWYRLLVDIKVAELEEKCDGNLDKLRKILRKEYGINCL